MNALKTAIGSAQLYAKVNLLTMYYPFEMKWTWALSINDFVMTLNLYLYIDHNYIELKYLFIY